MSPARYRPKARLAIGNIEARIKIINAYSNTFKNAHRDLVKITPKELKGNLPYFLNEEFSIYEDLYNIIHGDLKDMLIKLSTNSSNETSMNISISNSCPQNSLYNCQKYNYQHSAVATNHGPPSVIFLFR